MEKTCKNCKWYLQLIVTSGNKVTEYPGTCRKHAPIGVRHLFHGKIELLGLWPEVSKNEWCGKFCFDEEE